MIHVLIEPEMVWTKAFKCKSVRGVLNRLDLDADQTLVIDADGQLLTPDRIVPEGSELKVRKVNSRG
ncbi:MAG: hypothetical protein ACQES5_02710 [Thermodesulfobacteriota bacterium]